MPLRIIRKVDMAKRKRYTGVIKEGDRVQIGEGRCGEVAGFHNEKILVVFNEDAIWDAFDSEELKVVPKTA